MKRLRIWNDAWTGWSNHKCSLLGAALAYYAIFSVAPLLMIVVGLAGLFLHDEATQKVTNQLEQFVGSAPAHAISGMLKNGGKAPAGLGPTILGLLTILVGATQLFVALQDTLNTIWEVPITSWKRRIRSQAVSFIMVAVSSLVLLISMVASMVLLAMSKSMHDVFRFPPWAMEAINFGLSFVVVTLLFAMIYRFLPDTEVAWGDTWAGAAATALLCVLGKFLVGLYLVWAGVESAYGAAGSLVVLLIWVYYTSQIFLFGAEYTRAYATALGSRSRPLLPGKGNGQTKPILSLPDVEPHA